MAEFNPYQSWLHVSTMNGEPPNNYQLLGLADFEENLQAISKAAEKQLSRLLAINPEKHRPLWQKLINDLAEAQSILTHPEHKANYDNHLRGESTSQATIPEPVSAPTVTTASAPARPGPSVVPSATAAYQVPQYQIPQYQVPQYLDPPYQAAAPLAAPGYAPEQSYPAYGQASFQNPPPPLAAQPYAAPYPTQNYGQPVYAQPQYGQPDLTQPTYAQPVYGQPNPPPHAPPAYGQPVYNPAPAHGYAPLAAPVYQATAAHDPQASAMPNPMAPFNPISPQSNSGYGNPGAAAPGAFSAAMNAEAPFNNSRSPLPGSSQNDVEEDANFGEPLATRNPYRATRQESPLKYLVAAILVVAVILGGLIVNAKYGGKNSDTVPVAQSGNPPPAKQGKATPEIVPGSAPTDPQQTDPKNTEPMPVPPEPMKPEMTNPEPVKPEPVKPEPVMPEPVKPEPVKPVPPMPEPAKPEPMKPEPPPPEPPKPEPTVASSEQQAAILAKLAEVRLLLGERNFAEAKQILNQVKELSTTPDMQELHLGMELVVDYTEQFWQAVQSSMRTLSGEIMVGSSLANVVNSEAGEITIRIAGANKNYKYASLPPGLALAIATKWFDKKPANKALLGAFYYVSKTGNIDEARKYWKEAGSGGVEVKYMLLLLDNPAIHGK